METTERRYVPHARTGEPVPVLTEEEQEAQRREKRSNPAILVSGAKCWCGVKIRFRREGFWMWSGDSVSVSCRKGHESIIRFVPETLGGGG